MRRVNIAILLIFIGINVQAEAVLSGYVRNAISKVVDFKIRNLDFLEDDVVYSARLNNQGFFNINIPLDAPQIVELIYARNVIELFLEPNDELHIEFEANTFKYSMQFSGQAGANNRFLNKFKATFPTETNPFKLTGYRKGTVHYQVESEMDKWMRKTNEGSFLREMNRKKERKMQELDLHQKNYSDLSSTFMDYLWAEIQYDWAYNLLIYGYTFGNLHQITNSFWDFIYEAPLSAPASLNSYAYRKFIKGYVNYKFQTSGIGGNKYNGQYQLAKTLLTDESLSYFQSFILIKGFKKEQFIQLIDAYNNFLSSNPYQQFDGRVVDAFYEANKYAEGSPAPEFSLPDLYGNQVSLSDYRGKIVYIDFWASWCRPCIAKIEMVKTVKQHVNSDEIVFIHLNVEKEESRWLDQVNFRNIEGVNLHVPEGLDSEVLKSFNVKAIPEYFIIDKYGNFARKPAKSDSITLEAHLGKMVKQQ